MATATLRLKQIGQFQDARISFGDLTILVGPQASGKSIALQWLKLLLDMGAIQEQLRQHGYDWSNSLVEFMDIYFGEGMSGLWREGESTVYWNHKEVDLGRKVARLQRGKDESLFLVPAQRVLTLRDGWPRPFSDFQPGDPYVVRAYSERLRLLIEQGFSQDQPVFPRPRRLKNEYRDQLQEHIFADFNLIVDRVGSRKRLVLSQEGGGNSLPYMVWSAGQREFVPLLLGLYWLMPSTQASRQNKLSWVVIEEPEMGLHPRAVSVVLLLVLELLSRGYRVCLSTHSPQILELVWVLQALRRENADPRDVLKMFGLVMSANMKEMTANLLTKDFKVNYFEGSSGKVVDITGLDPSSKNSIEQSWGGLMEFSALANDLMAHTVSGSGGNWP